MEIADCSESCKAAILEILNDAILTSTALYDYKPRTLDMMDAWFAGKRQGGYPVVGAFVENGRLAGFASYGPFRNFPAYKYTIEHSLYVARDMRGKGIGKRLLEEIIRRAGQQDYHVLVAGIDAENAVSIRMHQAAGFEFSGKIEEAGFKFGKWLDLVFYRKKLPTPAAPRED